MIWFRYVALHEVGAYLAKGWTIDDDMADTHHGVFAVLMKFVGEGEPK